MADNDVFSTDPVELDLGFNDLVGEDKKYKEPDALAKGYAHIERHSRTLESELAGARAKIDALTATKNQSNDSQNPRQDHSNEPDPANPNPNPTPKKDVDFRSQIKEEIKALNDEGKALSNIEATAQKLVDVFGNQASANEAVRKRANELGVSVEWLRDSAAQSPSAFYATMGITVTSGTDRSTPTPNNEVNFRNDGGDQKNFEYFDRLRKDNPKLYFSAATQGEMMNQARKMGAAFYKR